MSTLIPVSELIQLLSEYDDDVRVAISCKNGFDVRAIELDEKVVQYNTSTHKYEIVEGPNSTMVNAFHIVTL